MFALPIDYAAVDCRSASVSACEQDVDPRSPVEALGSCFQIKLRDTIDFSVDFGPWLTGNGSPSLTAAAWTAAAGSPKAPNIQAQSFSPAGRCVVVLAVAAGAVPGDAYWLDITAHVGATTPSNPTDLVIPPRVLTRRINVVVVNG